MFVPHAKYMHTDSERRCTCAIRVCNAIMPDGSVKATAESMLTMFVVSTAEARHSYCRVVTREYYMTVVCLVAFLAVVRD
jgi:hypothetical protein